MLYIAARVLYRHLAYIRDDSQTLNLFLLIIIINYEQKGVESGYAMHEGNFQDGGRFGNFQTLRYIFALLPPTAL